MQGSPIRYAASYTEQSLFQRVLYWRLSEGECGVDKNGMEGPLSANVKGVILGYE